MAAARTARRSRWTWRSAYSAWAKLATSPESCRDISERKRAEEELRETAAELARSNIDLQQFAYVASHDLQEPLRAIAGCVQILQKRYWGQLDTRADELIAHAVDGVSRMHGLINDLLAYSRLGTRGKEFKTTDCNGVLRMALSNLSASIAEAGAVIAHDELPSTRADGVQLIQVFQNLLSNAIKFRGEERPRIHVGVQPQNGEWLFSVRDNGIGIHPDYFDRIFVIFQRLHTRKEYPGTGIGLAICKKIVERHGGRMWVESGPGEGSTFYFSIPAGRGMPSLTRSKGPGRSKSFWWKTARPTPCSPRRPWRTAGCAKTSTPSPMGRRRWLSCVGKESMARLPARTSSCSTSTCRRWTAGKS